MPPVKNAAATRANILASARQRFLDESYDHVGLREIAGDAGVDVALVGRYFGSKEQLFKEVVRKQDDSWLDPALGADALPAHLASLAAAKDQAQDRQHIENLLIILRSASSPKAAAVVREAFREDVLEPLARQLGGQGAEVRASMAMSALIGTTVLRTIMSVEPLCECDHDQFRERLERLLEAALAEK